MRRSVWLLTVMSVSILGACQNDSNPTAESASLAEKASVPTNQNNENATIIFTSGVRNGITRGDKYNYFAIEGIAEGYDRVTAIIEGTAVDFRDTNNTWKFDYPYPGPSVETKITFTTDTSITYGDTGIALSDLEDDSYITITFVPNEDPIVTQPSFKVNEGESQSFSSDTAGISELVTITSIKEIDAIAELNPLGDKLLEVKIDYVNNGTAETYIAPNYFTAVDGDGKFLPLRYTHFWLHTVAPGQSFTDTAYFDISGDGPYVVQFFDGAWLDLDSTTSPANEL